MYDGDAIETFTSEMRRKIDRNAQRMIKENIEFRTKIRQLEDRIDMLYSWVQHHETKFDMKKVKMVSCKNCGQNVLEDTHCSNCGCDVK